MGNSYTLDADTEGTEAMTDPIVEHVREKLLVRSQTGIGKYGVTVARTDLTTFDWLIHAQEEAMDLAVYLERVIQNFKANQVAEYVRDRNSTDDVSKPKSSSLVAVAASTEEEEKGSANAGNPDHTR